MNDNCKLNKAIIKLKSKEGEEIVLENRNVDIRLGDFTKVLDDIQDNSIDMILTDPPYPYEFLHCWKELGEFAQKKLKDGGFLIAYSGQLYLPEVIQNVLTSGMKWYWLGSCLHGDMNENSNLRQSFEVNMFNKHKPILFFYKGTKNKQENWCKDVFLNKKSSKDFHQWGQGLSIFDEIIKIFNPKLVVDPFLGGGTTAIACMNNNINFIGCDIDEVSFNISKKRIKENDNR